jgi:hypothetical protein
MASIASDRKGNTLLGYSVSDSSTKPAIRLAGRGQASPPGQVGLEVAVKAGQGSQFGTSRWGDYSTMAVDPADDCTFWFTGQYLDDDGTHNWRTTIVSASFQGCAAP